MGAHGPEPGFCWGQSWETAWRGALLSCGKNTTEWFRISVEVHVASALEKQEKLWIFSVTSCWYPPDSGVGRLFWGRSKAIWLPWFGEPLACLGGVCR